MASLPALYDQESACLARIAELSDTLDALWVARRGIGSSADEMRAQLSRKAAAAQRAGEISGTRLGRRYSERMGEYLCGEVSRGLNENLDEAIRRTDAAIAKVEEELEDARRQLSSVRSQIEAEYARQRAEQARLEREAAERASLVDGRCDG